MNKLRKIIERNDRHILGQLRKDDGSITEPGEDTLRYLCSKQFPDATSITEPRYSDKRIKSSLIMERNIPWINKELVIKAMNTFKAKKSPGPDGMKPLLFKHLLPNIIEILVFIYKAMIILNVTPKSGARPGLFFCQNHRRMTICKLNLGDQ